MTAPALIRALRDVLDGDVRKLYSVIQSSDSELLEAAEEVGDLILRKEALRAVLEAWRLGQVSESEVQLWGAFA